MKCIKKLVALTLAAVLALTMLTACGGMAGRAPTTPAVLKEGTADLILVGNAETIKKDAAALNEARVAAGKEKVPFDEEYSVKLTEYANAYTNWQFAWRAYDQDQTAENKATLDAAKRKYDEVSKELPSGVSKGKMLKVNVAAFDNVKANGRNYFAGTDKNGNYYPLATQEGNMCAVTVITKEDLTFAIVFVGTK